MVLAQVKKDILLFLLLLTLAYVPGEWFPTPGPGGVCVVDHYSRKAFLPGVFTAVPSYRVPDF